jgi:predicted CXXCH cytochrome family protein
VTDKLLVLDAGAEGSRSVLCETCHSEKPSMREQESLKRYSHPVNVKPDSAEIPNEWPQEKVVLGPGGQITCRTCHTPHRARTKKGLLAERHEKDSFCLQCHEAQRSVEGTKHDLNIMDPGEKNLLGQRASKSGPCSTCHLTHQGTGPFMWARELQSQDEPLLEACASCHAKDGPAEKKVMPAHYHPPGRYPETINATEALPLYTAAGKKDWEKGRVYCSSCHNTHQWDPSNAKEKGSKETDGDRTNSFLKVTNRSSLLCLECHDDKKTIEGTVHDLARSAPEAVNKTGESPERSGLCGVCHLPHEGEDFLMWGRDLPGTGMAMTRACVTCHTSARCGEKKPVSDTMHPIEIESTESPPTKLPLYTEAGLKDEGGRIFCSTCHDSHLWNPANLDERNSGESEGNTANSFLRITSHDLSPLCLDCHKDQGWVEGTEHDLRLLAPEERNLLGQGPSDSGLCGDGACAEAKQPQYALHPQGLYIARIRGTYKMITREEYEAFKREFPVYTDSGERSMSGNIVCSTCHNPHQWDPFVAANGPGKEVEGNATNSFLRKNLYFNFCASCHALEGIYKFKFFHAFKGRQKDVGPIILEE